MSNHTHTNQEQQGCCGGQCASSHENSHDAHEHQHDHQHESEHSHHHGESCCSSQGSVAQEPLEAVSQGNVRLTWQISGMDCPSCAKKSKLPSLRLRELRARVLFATEKLVVDTPNRSVTSHIEQAVKKRATP